MRNSIIATLGFIILYSVFFLYVDRTVILWVKPLTGNAIYEIANFISLFAAGTLWLIAVPTVLLVVVLYEYFAGANKISRCIIYMLLSIIVANIVGAAFKFLLGRYRPVMYYEYGLYGFHYLVTKWVMHSTPSGHTLRIFALMTSLAFVCKRYSWLFLLIAALVGLSRIIVHAHYPSDVLFGAYIGIMAAVWVRWRMNFGNK
jgi:membrane-associated phospholipid phosphatase